MSEEIKEMIEASAPVEKIEQPIIDAKEKSKQDNLSAMRKKLEAEESARKDAERRAEEAERRAAQRSEVQQTDSNSNEEEIGDPDDVVVNKNLQKTAKKLSSKMSESDKKISELQQRLEYFEAKNEIESIKDFNDVVSDDNIKTFARLYPEEYGSIMANPNLRAKSKMAYNMIKNYGIANASPLLKQAEEIKVADKKIEANKLKPSNSAPSSSPMSRLGRYNEEGRLVLTDEDRNKINAEVRRKLQQSY